MTATTSLLSSPWSPSAPAASRLEAAPMQLVPVDPADGWRYAWQQWRSVLGGVLQGHRLRPRRARAYRTTLRIDEATRGRWHDFFGHAGRRSADAPCSFLYGQGMGTLVAMRLFADVGVKPQHVLHLRHQSWHPHGATACTVVPQPQLQCRLKRAVRVAHAAAVLVVETEYIDTLGRIVALVEDSYIVRRLDIAEVVNAENDAVLRRAVGALRRREAELSPQAQGASSATWTVTAAQLRGYARLAGDIDAARSLPLAGPDFMQGTHLRHLVACELSRLGVDAPRLAITFVRKVRAGRALRFVLHDERFEVCDHAGRLVAFGSL